MATRTQRIGTLLPPTGLEIWESYEIEQTKLLYKLSFFSMQLLNCPSFIRPKILKVDLSITLLGCFYVVTGL